MKSKYLKFECSECRTEKKVEECHSFDVTIPYFICYKCKFFGFTAKGEKEE